MRRCERVAEKARLKCSSNEYFTKQLLKVTPGSTAFVDMLNICNDLRTARDLHANSNEVPQASEPSHLQ